MPRKRIFRVFPSMTLVGVLFGSLGFAASAAAEELAFVEATTELDDGKLSSTPYNVVDGSNASVWCSKRSPDSEVLSFGFEKAATITQVSVVIADAPGDKLDKTRRRAHVVVISDGETKRELQLKDIAGAQSIELSPPAKGTHVTFEFKEMYDGAVDNAPLCVAEVGLKSRDHSLTPSSAGTKAKALSSAERKLLHAWVDDVSAPSKTFVFNLDGTFAFRFEPLMEGKPVRVRGKWTAGDRSVTLDWNGKTYPLKARLTKVDEGEAHTVELALSGEAPVTTMIGELRPAPTKHPR